MTAQGLSAGNWRSQNMKSGGLTRVPSAGVKWEGERREAFGGVDFQPFSYPYLE